VGGNLFCYDDKLDIMRGHVGRNGIDWPPLRHTSQTVKKASKKEHGQARMSFEHET